MIVSHKYKFVIAVPNGLGCGPWLERIRDEGVTEYLEIVGHPNSVVIPEGCYDYQRFIVDSHWTRPFTLWFTRKGTPWEGPVQIQDDPEEWMKWYVFKMRGVYGEIAAAATPNGWGMRLEEGEWMWFESAEILTRTLAGFGNSPKGADAPWGRKSVRVLKLNERMGRWRDVLGFFRTGDYSDKICRDLIDWHMPEMAAFYEFMPEIATAMFKNSAWSFERGYDKWASIESLQSRFLP